MSRWIPVGKSGSDTVVWQPVDAVIPDDLLWCEVLRHLVPSGRLRPLQAQAIRDHQLLTSRRNLIVSAPTNSGKSLVGLLMLLNAIRTGQRAVLLEPLRTLAQEKADEYEALAPALGKILGRPFTVTISTGDYRLQEETMAAPPPHQGELIIATPERLEAILRNPAYDGWLQSIGALCVDEAHLLSTPRRGPTLEHLITAFLCLPTPPRIALLSATVGDTSCVQQWLAPCDLIHITERYPLLHKQILALDTKEDAGTVVQAYAQQVLADPTTNLLIFVYQTKSAERLAATIGKETQIRALPCHGQMSSSARQQAQAAFRDGDCRCLVATTALSLGVNLPATHVLIRDNTFPGVGRLSAGDLLQMMGRAGRGDEPGWATVLVRPTDQWGVDELTTVLQEERVADLASALATLSSDRRRTDQGSPAVEIVANRVAAHLARQSEEGVTMAAIYTFFSRSLGGTYFATQIPSALHWLTDPMRLLAYQDEQERYHLTVLGRKASRTVLPLSMVAGIAQLIRDLLTIDPTDALLTRWQPLDTLFLLNLLHDRTPTLRPYSAALVEQIDSWMERSPAHHALLYSEWLRGGPAHSRAEEVLGSLGVTAPERTNTKGMWAHRLTYGALLNSIILYERGQGVSQEELTRQWRLNNLAGVEERWRDDCLWLLSGSAQLFELRAFFYHLKESCQADSERIRLVKRRLRRMARQCYQLQAELRYCSPLGSFFYSIRHAMAQPGKAVVGVQSMRRLEAAGITSPQALAQLTVEELVSLGLRREFARQIHTYLRRRLL